MQILGSLSTSLKGKMDSLVTENIQRYDGIEQINENSYIVPEPAKSAYCREENVSSSSIFN
ncbi:MAG: hypothetical protein FWG10_09180 [Eubacteriaceae bacterium]|nr:hypothetical protein [Eubacteriaceae bacterium]